MIRRFLARRRALRMQRWAVRHHQDWKVQFWVEQRRKERRREDWPDIVVTSIYGWAETDAS